MLKRLSPEQHIERLRFRRAPLAAAGLWLAAGIVCARLTPHAPAQLVAGMLLLFAFAMLLMKSRLAWIPVGALWFTFGIAAAEWQPATPPQTSLLNMADNLSRKVHGHVLRVHHPAPVSENRDADTTPSWEAAEDTSHQRGQPVSLDLAVDQVEEVTPDVSTMLPVSGGVRVAVFGADPGFDPACGSTIEVPLRLKLPEQYRTPGGFDYADWLLRQGIAAHANVAASALLISDPIAPTFRCRLFAAQTWSSGRLLRFASTPLNQRLWPFLRLSSADALMLDAMLFGDRTGLNHSLRTGFERTGTFHLFVVSGLHVALLAGGLFSVLRRFRAPTWLATVVTLLGTFGYTLLTGFGQPAQRALIMTSVFLVARLLSRDRDPVNALGAAILVMLAIAPSSLFDPSFQMTVLVIVAIGGIAVPLSEHSVVRHARLTRFVFLRPRRVDSPRAAQLVLMLEVWGETLARLLPNRLEKLTRRLPAEALRLSLLTLELGLISVIAELVMVLPMTLYFHRLPIFAVPANMLILPLIGVLVPAALMTFLAALVSPWLAAVPGAATAVILHSVTFVINRLSGLHSADLRVPAPALWMACCATLAWIVCCWLARRSRMTATGCALALPLIGLALVWPEAALTTPGALEVTALDVGQGDSLLVVNPEGDTMLIDAGGPVGSHGSAETVSAFDVGEEVVAPYLWTRRVRRLDVLVLSHAHSDHMGGMPAILHDLRPRELWVGSEPESPLFAALLSEAAQLNIPVLKLHAGNARRWGSVDVDVLAPAVAYVNHSAPRNDDSLVLHMQFGKVSVLLEGDAERPSEDTMLQAGLLHPVTLLKVGHHGSKTSSNPEFLSAVQPQEAVISVGRRNTFGHPRAEVIERLADAHTRVFRTDLFGLRTFLLSPDGAIHDVSAPELEPSRQHVH